MSVTRTSLQSIATDVLVGRNLVAVCAIRGETLLCMNERCANLLGYSDADLDAGVPLRDVVVAADWPKVEQSFRQTIANPGSSSAITFNAVRKDGSIAEFVENVMWEQSGVVFVTVNLPGGSTNDEDNWYGQDRTQPQTDEILKRTSADLRWLDDAFALAKVDHARAVLIQLQADMWDLDGTARKDLHIANYRQFIDSIALHTILFGKPVLLLNGDSHVYRSDNPLVKGAPCLTENGASVVTCSDDAYDNQPNDYNVKNFHRIVVHGSTAPMEWIKLEIKTGDSDGRASTNSFGPFSWTRMIQPLP